MRPQLFRGSGRRSRVWWRLPPSQLALFVGAAGGALAAFVAALQQLSRLKVAPTLPEDSAP